MICEKCELEAVRSQINVKIKSNKQITSLSKLTLKQYQKL